MTILQVHNFYQQPGGEDEIFRAEHALLTGRGHTVFEYVVHNDAINDMSPLSAGLKTIWNADTSRGIREMIQRQRPDIVHAHNTFPLISPALYYAASAERVPVVQTLHNYRLLCAGGNFFRDGEVCERCLGAAVPAAAVWHRCYRKSGFATGAVGAMLVTHRLAGTWRNRVQTYIALTEFAKRKFIEGGLPGNRIAVKPNFLLNDPGFEAQTGDYALFAGRLSEEKGIRTLLEAWERLGATVPLKIAGAGPLSGCVEERIASLAGVQYLGFCPREQLKSLIRQARVLIFPSVCYEGLPVTIIEALASGTPVIASALGSMNELIEDGVNGFHFRAGDSNHLVAVVESCFANAAALRDMRRAARFSYEQNYTPDRNYLLLLEIYEKAIRNAAAA
ncbi:MAG: glycosyltransferase [Acidobacteriaceae bacterium]|nr:glycosyltransferase [Acidobacteriaceae bacterium]